MLFQLRQPPIFQHSKHYLHGYVGVSEKSQFVGNEMRMQTCGQTELLQMFGVTTIGSHCHVGNQALGKDRHRLVHVFSWHLFPNGVQSDFQLISYLILRLEFMILFQHGAPGVIVQWVQIRAWGPLSLLDEPVRIQSVLHDACTLRKTGCLGRNSIILLFSDIFQPNLVLKCIFDCLTVSKISCKNLHSRLKYQQKLQRATLFVFTR